MNPTDKRIAQLVNDNIAMNPRAKFAVWGSEVALDGHMSGL